MTSQTAITEQGKTVILNDDNTWEFSEVDVSSTNNAFRNTCWGMTEGDVRSIEGIATLRESENSTTYAGYLAGLECEIIYLFAQNQLVRGKYAITAAHSDKNKYFQDFDTLLEALKIKYGTSGDEELFWLNNTYRENFEDRGLAVSLGHCSRYAVWDHEETTIHLYLYGDNSEIQFGIEYGSKKLSYLEEQKREIKLHNDL